MTVQLRGKVFEGVKPAEDMDTEQALMAAQQLLDTFGKDVAVMAVVDRFDGLALIFAQPNLSAWHGWHFNSPICGYVGAGPITSARILALFGFGAYDDIFDRITEGGSSANFTFTK